MLGDGRQTEVGIVMLDSDAGEAAGLELDCECESLRLRPTARLMSKMLVMASMVLMRTRLRLLLDR